MKSNQRIFKEFENIANAIDELSESQSLLRVGVSGLGGSGKSTLCRRLSEHFSGRAFHFECDLFAKYGTVERRRRIADALESGDPITIEQEENPKNWYGWDDIEKTLEGLRRKGSYVFAHGWNQQTGEKDKEAVFQLPNNEHPILLVDCIYLLHDPVRNWFDLSVFVDTPLGSGLIKSTI